jgi:HSP20 family molecular chaperone IbpA
MARSIRFTRFVSLAGQIADQLQGLQFAAFPPREAVWQPAVNVYSHPDRLEVCVDLAGVPKTEIRVDVEPRRLVISGQRALPESGEARAGGCRILVMEIPDGGFERVLEFSVDVDPVRVSARQNHGWLWISLPYAGREGTV